MLALPAVALTPPGSSGAFLWEGLARKRLPVLWLVGKGWVFQMRCQRGGQVVGSVKEPAPGGQGEGTEPGVLGADGVQIAGQGGRHAVTEA